MAEKLNIVEKIVGSGLYTGFIPFAPGTFGSLAALIIYAIPGFEGPEVLIPFIILFTLYGINIGNKFEDIYGKDPSECTIDEVVGMWISLLFLPKEFWISIAAFIIWRIFDIIKPFPARRLEALSGGLGIMADDIVAALYSLIFLHMFLFIFA